MSATITEVTITTILSNSYDTLSSNFGIIAILLLIVLLTLKEVMRASSGLRSRTWVQILNTAIIPLLMAFALIIVMRFLHLLRWV
jgi:hypothetical protein